MQFQLDLVVERLDTHLPIGRTDTSAEVNPSPRAADQFRTLSKEPIESEVPKFVAA